MKLLHYHSQNYPSGRPARLVYFAEVPKFLEEQLTDVEKKKEAEEPEKLDTRSLVEQANAVIAKHELQLAVLPKQFNQLMHDEMVTYFLASPQRFEKDAESGLDSAEFSAYRNAMVSKVESVMAEYAPTQEEMEKIAESKHQAEKAGEAAEQIRPLDVSEVETGLGPIETVEDLRVEFGDYHRWNMSLQKESFDLLQQAGELQTVVAKFHESRRGVRAYRKFLDILGVEHDQERTQVYTQLVAAETKLDEVMKKYQAAQEKLKAYGERLAARSNGLKQDLVAEYGATLEQVKEAEGEGSGAAAELEKEFEKVFLGFDQLDEGIDSAVLKHNVENQKLAEVVAGQKQVLVGIRDSLRAPEGAWETAKAVVQAPLDTASGACASAGEFVLDQAKWLSHFVKENRENIMSIPVAGGALYGIAWVQAEALAMSMGTAGGVLEMGSGVFQMMGHPVQTLEGLGSLVGLSSQVSAAQAWKEMGKSLISYEDFSHGRYGIGLGKLFTNIVTTVSGAAALKAGGKAAEVSYLTARAAEKSVVRAGLEATIAGTRAGVLGAYDVLKTDMLETADMVRKSSARVQEAFKAARVALDEALAKAPAAVRGKLQKLKESVNEQFSELHDELGLESTLVMAGPRPPVRKSLLPDSELSSVLEEIPPSSGLDRTVADAPLSAQASSEKPPRLDKTMPDSRAELRKIVPAEQENLIKALREANPEAFSYHGSKVSKAVSEGLVDDVPSEVMSLLAADKRKLLSSDAVGELVTGRVKPERIKILQANLDVPEFNVDYADRILSGDPETVLVNGKAVAYYPTASVGEGGVGVFFKVGILDPTTGKLRFAGAKQALNASRSLGTEIRGVKLLLEALEGNPEMKKWFAEPIAVADDGTLIFYEVVERNGVTQDLDTVLSKRHSSAKDAYQYLLDSFQALSFLHSKKLVHGDYKALQIFIGEHGGQLGDFGTVVTFDKYLENGGVLPLQTETAAGSPVFSIPIGEETGLVWMGKLPNYDEKYSHAAISPPYYSGDMYEAVLQLGPEYVWKVDAYAAGTQLEAMLTGKIKVQKARFNEDNQPIKITGEFFEEQVGLTWGLSNSFFNNRNKKLAAIAKKLKDPKNLTYTLAHATRDLEKILKSQ